MECKNCEQTRAKFVCASCLGRDLQVHYGTHSRLTTERDSLIAKATSVLPGLEAARSRRADIASLRQRLQDIHQHTTALREEIDSARERLSSHRATLSGRRQNLDEAYRLSPAYRSPPRTPTPTPPGGPPRRRSDSIARNNLNSIEERIKLRSQAHAALQDALAQARQGLVQELVDVFCLVEVGGRPAAGLSAGRAGAWAIGGLVLPVPGDIRRCPPQQINAALTFTLHFLGLLTFYLGVRLPFLVVWSGNKFGVGVPEIYAGQGAETGGWAKWTVRNPLHFPLSTTTAPSSSSPPTTPANPTSPSHYPPALHTPSKSTSDSTADLEPVLSSPGTTDSISSIGLSESGSSSFTVGLAMLLYNVAYLAHTQGITVPLSSAGDTLRNLWAICSSAELGLRSHATHPLLPLPTPPSFQLDFKQLLQAITADPATRPRSRSRRGSTSTAGGTKKGARKGAKYDTIVEEEDWEVVNDAF